MWRRSFLSFLRRSFYVKMVLIMLLVSVVPLLSLAYLSLYLFAGSFDRQLSQANEQVVHQVTERIETTMSRLQQLSFQYAMLPSVTNALVPDTSGYEMFSRSKDLIETFDTGLLVIGDADDLMLYNAANGLMLSSKQAVVRLEESRYRRIVEAFIQLKQPFFFMNADMAEADPDLLGHHSYFMRRIPMDPFSLLQGVLIISVDNRSFAKLIEPIDFGPKAAFSIASPRGDVVATSSEARPTAADGGIRELIDAWEASGRARSFKHGDTVVAMQQASGFYPWIVVSEVPRDEMAANTRIVRKSLFVYALGLIGLGVLGTAGLGYFLYRPLQQIKQHMRWIERGDFTRRNRLNVQNEIGELGGLLNSMSARLEQLVGELKETENAKRKQEIRALQAQINPHFLYNCLNSISMFAMLRDYGKIREMMVSLLSLLRYSMEHLEQTVALKRELDYLGHYTRMMQLRYSRPFRLEIEVDPALDSMKIPKLLLQPLMENALIHGVLASEPGREGLIRVAAGYADDGRSVQLLVADNGAGMEPGRLKRIRTLLSEPSNPDNIGLRNVWERLKLVFGPQASLDIESEAGTGTTIRISLPADQVIMESEATTNDV